MTADAVVVDSSVFVAIFKDEPDAERLIERASSYSRRLTSAATWLESVIVCERAASRNGGDRFKGIAKTLSIEVVPFTSEQAYLAFEAFKRFGKGRGAKASLNYGDCFVYALAKELGAPVLFKGNDFALTDLKRA